MATEKVILQKGLDNIIVKETKLSYIDGEKGALYYGGYRIEDLCKYSSYEEVLHLLWYGSLPNRQQTDSLKKSLKEQRNIPREVFDIMRTLPRDSNTMDILRTAVSALGLFDSEPDDNSRDANIRKAIRLTAKMTTIVAAIYRIKENLTPVAPNPKLDHASNFMYMMFEREPDELTSKTMDVSLILHVEHELPASTMACITTASTLSDMYSAIVSGIGTLKGQLHGGANEKALQMLKEINRPDGAEQYVMNALKEKKKLMGFGHRVYKAYDPRARIFLTYLKQLSDRTGDHNFLEIGERVEKTMIRELGAKGIFPNIDFYSGAVYNLLGIPSYLFTPMFAMARIGGWTSHVIEYLEDNRLIRPRTNYIGKLDLQYIPLEKR